MTIFYIYQIVCKQPNITDNYVGSTKNFENRKMQHKNDCMSPSSIEYYYKKYLTIRQNGGWDCWLMNILEEVECKSFIECRIREQYYIDILKPSMNSVKAYNKQIIHKPVIKSVKTPIIPKPVIKSIKILIKWKEPKIINGRKICGDCDADYTNIFWHRKYVCLANNNRILNRPLNGAKIN